MRNMARGHEPKTLPREAHVVLVWHRFVNAIHVGRSVICYNLKRLLGSLNGPTVAVQNHMAKTCKYYRQGEHDSAVGKLHPEPGLAGQFLRRLLLSENSMYALSLLIRMCMYVCMYVCMHCVCVCMHVKYVCVYVCMFYMFSRQGNRRFY
jgi:hypothetical protein